MDGPRALKAGHRDVIETRPSAGFRLDRPPCLVPRRKITDFEKHWRQRCVIIVSAEVRTAPSPLVPRRTEIDVYDLKSDTGQVTERSLLLAGRRRDFFGDVLPKIA